MVRPLFKVPRHLLQHALLTFFLGTGCVLPLCMGLNLIASVSLVLLVCGILTLFLSFMECMPRLQIIVYPLILAAIAFLVWRHIRELESFQAALILAFGGQTLALLSWSRPIVVLLALFFTVI